MHMNMIISVLTMKHVNKCNVINDSSHVTYEKYVHKINDVRVNCSKNNYTKHNYRVGHYFQREFIFGYFV